MDVNQHLQFLLPDASYLNSVKRDIARLAHKAGFSEIETGKINIVVAEMASNLIRHVPPGGQLLVRFLEEQGSVSGIEIICLDIGPGMAEPRRMLEDGVSTYGSAGEGLGAIKRQSDFFDLYSQPKTGTIVLSRIFKTEAESKKPAKEKQEIGAIVVSKRVGDKCGDGWFLKQDAFNTYILALDGLGHGELAHEASQQAIETFKQIQTELPAEILLQLHEGLKHTRGAVGAIAKIRTDNKSFRYCGIGNITSRIFGFNDGGELIVTKNLMSYNGTLGHIIPGSFQEQTAEWHPGNLLVMHSDGLKTQVELKRYPKIQQHDASLIAAALFRDYNRGTDDAVVLIAKAIH
jgi:anti-sigma regulatory factor (Ser/Thr protein kinase)